MQRIVVIIASIGTIVLLSLTIYLSHTSQTSTNDTQMTKGATTALTLPSSTVIQNITYCEIAGYSEQLDIREPLINSSSTELPVVIWVHGGGWVNGSKINEPDSGFWNAFLQEGIAVASADYYMPNSQLNQTLPGFPINIEDIACAVRYLRANANLYHINPWEIGLDGGSAGGQLVSLEALGALNGTFDSVGQWQGVSSAVEAVSDEYGLTNLTDSSFASNPTFTSYGPAGVNVISYVFNGTRNLFAASPVNYVTKGAPPFLIEQGLNDTIVYPIQSIMLYNSLKRAGDNVSLILVQNAGHNFIPYQAGIATEPSLQQILADIAGFFNQTLGG